MSDNTIAPLVFFDLDGTLIRGPSCEQRFFLLLLRKGVAGWRQLAAFCAVGLQGLGRRKNVWKTNKAYLAGLSSSAIAALGETFALARLKPAVHPMVKERLDEHLAAGDRVVLMTGAPDFMAHPLAAILGIPLTAATECAREAARYSAAMPSVHPYGDAKRRIAARLCRTHGTTLADSTAYANAFSDLSLLNAVGRPVAVFPDRRLRRLAAARGWEVIDRRMKPCRA